MFLQLFIINKSGGLIYKQDLSTLAPKVTTNDWLRLGSTFHSLYAIAAQVAPLSSSGIQKLETETFKLHCFQSRTGIKFVVTAEASTPGTDLETLLSTVYELFADYVLKNPFYELEMPVRCELFTQHLNSFIEKYVSTQRNRSIPPSTY
mmetsp:Transcript_19006/g.25047  ORF Transcript_19006/g.25047 Transcript_19006/m.25047 type:complete len:149 (+) Transcript_19006:60-506(+)